MEIEREPQHFPFDTIEIWGQDKDRANTRQQKTAQPTSRAYLGSLSLEA